MAVYSGLGFVGLGHTSIFVALADLDGHTLTHFYRALFVQEPTIDIPNVYAEFDLLGVRLGLFKPQNTHRTEFESLSSGSLSLCIEVERLEVAIAHLTTLGYPPPGTIQSASHGREIYAYDPQGNRLILHEAVATVLG
jgi:hypothetical protein